MPRGRPRKTAEAELLPPEDNQSLQQVREVKHKTEWVELRPVEEATEGENEEFEGVEIEDRQPRRKTPKSERDELRKKLAANNVTPASNLKLTIEKYLHSEVLDGAGGMSGDTEHCTKYPCIESHITNEDYLDVARSKWGAGMYRFTLRMQNKIVTAWDKRISAGTSGPVIQHVNPNDPTSPQVIIQSTNGDGQAQIPMSIKDIMKTQREALKEQLEMAKLMREAYGFAPDQPQQQPKSEEEVLANAIINRPEVVDSLVGSVLKRVGGKGSGDDEPWYADVVRDAVKSGQAAQVVKTAIDSIFGGFRGLFPGGQNNGQAPVAPPPFQTNGPTDSRGAPDGRTVVAQEIPQGNQSLQPASGEVDSQGGMLPAGQQQITPEQHALSRLIQNCQRNIPVQVAFQQLVNYADAINEQAPDYSIDGYIDLLGSMETDQVIEFVKALPGGEQVVGLSHCREWTTELQRLIKESQEGGDE